MFRPMWASSGVKNYGRGNCCLLFRYLGSCIKSPRCACVEVGSNTSSVALQIVQTGSGAHPASYPVGTMGSFVGGKAAGAWS
jgi:hypothetical protein